MAVMRQIRLSGILWERHGTYAADQREHCKNLAVPDRSLVMKDQKKTRGKTNLLRMLREQRAMKFFTIPMTGCGSLPGNQGTVVCGHPG